MRKLTARIWPALLGLVLMLGVVCLPAEAAAADPLDSLKNSIPAKGYMGDIAKLNLSSDEAEAISSVLRNWNPTQPGGYPPTICLVDAEGNGKPVVSVHYNIPGEVYQEVAVDEIYAWQGGSLVKVQELSASGLSTYTMFGPNSQGGYSWVNGTIDEDGYDVNSTIYRLSGNTLVTSEYSFVPRDDGSGSTDLTADGTFLGSYDSYALTNEDCYTQLKEYGYPVSEIPIDYYNIQIGVDFPTLSTALQSFVDSLSWPEYDLPAVPQTDPFYRAVVNAASGAGDAEAVYRLSYSRFLLVVKPKDGAGYKVVTVSGSIQGGQQVWTASAPIAPPDDVTQMQQEAVTAETALNITIDSNDIANLGTVDDAAAYIQQRLDNVTGLALSAESRQQLSAFTDGWLANRYGATVTSDENWLIVIPETFSELAARAGEELVRLQDVYTQDGTDIGQPLRACVRIFWTDADPTSSMDVTLDSSLAGVIQGVPLRILLGDSSHFVEFSPDSIDSLVSEYGELTIRLTPEGDNAWDIEFLSTGLPVQKLSTPVTIGLPAASPTTTVRIMRDQVAESWGGQFDPGDGVIYFDTCFSSQYLVQEVAPEISDGGQMQSWNLESAAALVARGWLTLNEADQFRPADALTRYETALALAGMVFANDPELTQTYTDIPTGSPYSAAVAAAGYQGLMLGVTSTEFGGDQGVTTEVLLTITAGILTSYARFALPTNPDEILYSCPDKDSVSAWAKQQAALAVECGILAPDAWIGPQEVVNRERAAAILTRVFDLLKNVPSVPQILPDGTFAVPAGEHPVVQEEPPEPVVPDGSGSSEPEEPAEPQGIPTWMLIAGAVALVLIVAAAALVYMQEKKPGGAAEPGPDEENPPPEDGVPPEEGFSLPPGEHWPEEKTLPSAGPAPAAEDREVTPELHGPIREDRILPPETRRTGAEDRDLSPEVHGPAAEERKLPSESHGPAAVNMKAAPAEAQPEPEEKKTGLLGRKASAGGKRLAKEPPPSSRQEQKQKAPGHRLARTEQTAEPQEQAPRTSGRRPAGEGQRTPPPERQRTAQGQRPPAEGQRSQMPGQRPSGEGQRSRTPGQRPVAPERQPARREPRPVSTDRTPDRRLLEQDFLEQRYGPEEKRPDQKRDELDW